MAKGRGRRLLAWLARSVLLLAALAGAAYVTLTSPWLLRRVVESAVQRGGMALVQLGEISYTTVGGLEFEELELIARSDPDGPRVAVRRGSIKADGWPFIFSEPQVESVELRGVRFELPVHADKWVDRWREHGLLPSADPQNAQHFPSIIVRDLDIQLHGDADGQAAGRRWIVDLLAQPSYGVDADGRMSVGYALAVTQTAGLTDARAGPPERLLTLELREDRLTASSSWLDSELVDSLLPSAWRETLRTWDMAGRVRIVDLACDRHGLEQAQIEIADARLAAPFEGADVDPVERWFRPRGVAGLFEIKRTASSVSDPPCYDLSASVSGLQEQATWQLSTTLTGIRGSWPARGADPSIERWEAECKVEGLITPSLAEQRRLAAGKQLPDPLRAFLEDYQPEGSLDLEFSGSGGAGQERRVASRIFIRDATIVYFRFPYRIEGISGVMRYEGAGLIIEELTGKHGPANLVARGKLDSTDEWTGFWLEVRASRVPLDEALYQALPERYQNVWRIAAPVGLCDVTTRITRAHGSAATGPLEPSVEVDTELLAGGIRLPDGARLRDAAGRLQIADARFELTNLAGTVHEDSWLRLDGELYAAPDGDLSGQIEFTAADWPLDHQLPAVEGKAGLKFAGSGDVYGRVAIEGGEAKLGETFATLRKGSIAGFDPAVPFALQDGWVWRPVGSPTLARIELESPLGSVQIGTVIDTAAQPATLTSVSCQAETSDIAQLIRTLCPPRVAGAVAPLQLRGPGTIMAELANVVDGGALTSGHIRVRSAAARPTFFPLELQDVAFSLEGAPSDFRLESARGKLVSGATVELAGRGAWGDGVLRWDLAARGGPLDLRTELLDALPESLAAALRPLGLDGSAQLNLSGIQVETRSGASPVVTVEGLAQFDRLRANVGWPLEAQRATLRGATGPARRGAELSLRLERGALAQRGFEWIETDIVQGDDGVVQLANVRGIWCGGELSGEVLLDMREQTYQLGLALRGASFGLLAAGPGAATADRSGQIDARIALRGSWRSPTKRSGNGEMIVRGASLRQTPVSASLLDAGQGRRPRVPERADQMSLRFVVRDDEVLFPRVEVLSADAQLIGEGRWTPSTDVLAVTLVSVFPSLTLGGRPLAELLESAGGELVHYEISGTLAKPQVEVHAMSRLKDALRGLFGER